MAEVFVGIGSSINRSENVQLGVAALQALFSDVQISPVYESEAVGFSGANFYNLVAKFTTNLAIVDVIKQLKKIELANGRPEFAIKFAPRTIDLDLLLYDQEIAPEFDLPRAEITKNAFVLKPLADLAPRLTDPLSGETYQNLWAKYPKEKQNLWKIEAGL
ncbi:2-amino-4-hydroxy-6-hydroxymethyldihydropteridine diphosphokinase [Psychromonas sp. MME2]|uniref:2-amino-4-hydroxy-6- hydroxymethyldihydropteridine diphosphokinase n=1 Tax=unclassified Psychromonas TaxID=2614957 RepID=UPI00339BFF24